ncbi:MAG: RimK family protein [Pseudomonadota bacterium]|nr:RimK family protein [Pseudomonadota bacterium]
MKNIIVTDQVELWSFLSDQVDVVSATDYLTRQDFLEERSVRVINLSRNYDYQSLGYYVSLLAEARGHKIFPSVMSIQDIKAATSRAIVDATIHDNIQDALKNIKSKEFVLSIYFGKNIAKKYNSLCAKLHELFPIPLIQVSFVRKREWLVQRIRIVCISEIPETHKEFFIEAAREYFSRKRFHFARIKNYLYDMAILVNEYNHAAPSDKAAIERFVIAGEKLGINAQPIKKENIKSLSDYDSLFIREPTSIMHWTYKLARCAQAEGMVVIDDPLSILRCTNKVYLAELLQNHKIPVPVTAILHRNLQAQQLPHIEYPCVLKRPDGCCSQGVVKVENPDELRHFANHYFKESELINAQNFFPTEFDWRNGVYDNKPIFACKYHMVKNHWKVLLWENEKECWVGNVITIDPKDVPPAVIQTALQGAALIGNGLYGVDLKQVGDKVYIIEINDNPSIDFECEDAFAGDQLYTDIMQIFLQRMQAKHEHPH